MKKIILFIAVIAIPLIAESQITLEDCRKSALENYPLIRQYDLIEKAAEYSIENAKRMWLPQLNLSAQATYQSDVATFPDKLLTAYSQMGIKMQGLNKDQYRAVAELSQTIWDGGASKAKRTEAKADAEIEKAQTDIERYNLLEMVNSLYFGILMLDAQTEQNNLFINLLQSNLDKINGFVKNGTALQSDAKTIEAELLIAKQQRSNIDAAANSYREMLSILTNKKIEKITLPQEQDFDIDPHKRPELHLLEMQSLRLKARTDEVNISSSPIIGAFAQGFYGNPGLNLFKDMEKNNWSWNYILGVKFQWNISSFYFKRNNLNKIELAQRRIENNRETFLFNTKLKTTQQQRAIEKMRDVIDRDDRIIELRVEVRKAAEAKLENGIIDVNGLLREITAESSAKIAKSAHKIELLKNIYDLKHTTNN